jgi:hypothetical protein
MMMLILMPQVQSQILRQYRCSEEGYAFKCSRDLSNVRKSSGFIFVAMAPKTQDADPPQFSNVVFHDSVPVFPVKNGNLYQEIEISISVISLTPDGGSRGYRLRRPHRHKIGRS